MGTISSARHRLLRTLLTRKGREKHQRCLVEGRKVITTAGDAVEFTFTRDDVADFDEIVSTETPQDIAGVARIPEWSLDDLRRSNTIVVLDGVQDPGNVGAILRLCLGFHASLVLVDSADVSAPKVVRASVGAMFSVPWMRVPRSDAASFVAALDRDIHRLEIAPDAVTLGASSFATAAGTPAVLVVGSEGHGITLEVPGASLRIGHDPALESLNVGHALAIALQARYAAADARK